MSADELRAQTTEWVGGQAAHWKQEARKAQDVLARLRRLCDETEAHCSANRVDAPPWVSHVRAILDGAPW